ncbi:MAG: aldehyde ferredoxin oxidoreductase family protein [Candidatus Aminicenantes bacterium]|nr:aldehyde ferredoxin oxidoreductase family protein [Candidatus Aminicenantes bacterium]
MKGCMGKVLFVDLSAGTFEERKIGEDIYERYLGGVGLAARLLYDEIPAGADPLGPQNILGFMSGLLTGTGSVMTGRWMAVCKSPLTGGWGDANCGGTLAPAIKQTGFDGILFKGVSPRPVVFVLDVKGPRLQDAGPLWGLDAVETEERLMKEYRGTKRPAVAAIGPAAEKLALISGISNDGGRYAARSGVGAVMGSKRLKAVVLSGARAIPCADPAGVKAISKKYAAKVRRLNLPRIFTGRLLPTFGRALGLKLVVPVDGLILAAILKKWGTDYNNTAGAVNGDSPIRNWGGSVADFGRRRYRKLNPDRMLRREIRKYHCYSCVVGCGGISRLDGPNGPGHSHKPEYETVAAFAGLLGNADLDSIYVCNDICNRCGLDTISAGMTIAFAIECFENGILTKEDTGGLELGWGRTREIVRLLEMMAVREGFGDVLADGVKRAAARIGRGAERFAIHVGGQEPAMHDSRMDPMMGVAYGADPTPGRHTIASGSYYYPSHLWEFVPWAPRVTKPYPKSREYLPSDEEAAKSAAYVCFKQLADAAGGCLFAMVNGLQHWRLFDYLNLATGWNRTPVDYMEAGRRIQTLRQLFNIKHGLEPRSFIIPSRLKGDPPLEKGPLAGRTVPLEAMIRNYWKALGWDGETGAPTPESRAALGL